MIELEAMTRQDYQQSCKDVLEIFRNVKPNWMNEFLDLYFPDTNDEERELIKRKVQNCIRGKSHASVYKPPHIYNKILEYSENLKVTKILDLVTEKLKGKIVDPKSNGPWTVEYKSVEITVSLNK